MFVLLLLLATTEAASEAVRYRLDLAAAAVICCTLRAKADQLRALLALPRDLPIASKATKNPFCRESRVGSDDATTREVRVIERFVPSKVKV